MVLLFILDLGLIGMFFFYKKTLKNVYSIFLSISDKNLKRILTESKKLSEFLSSNSNVYASSNSPNSNKPMQT